MFNFFVLALVGLIGVVLLRVVFNYILSGMAITTFLVGLMLVFCFSIMPVGMKKVVKKAVPKEVKDKVGKVFEGAGEVAGRVEVLVFGKSDTYWERGMSYLGVKVDGGISYVGKRLVDAIFSPSFLIFVVGFAYLKYRGFVNFSSDRLLPGKV